MRDFDNNAYMAARRHSRNVRILRLTLPTAAAALIAVAGLHLSGSYPELPREHEFGEVADGKSVMRSPVISGISGGRPYEVLAATAVRARDRTAATDFTGISARLPAGDNGWASLVAPSGSVNERDGRLQIHGPAEVSLDDGRKARFGNVEIDMNRGKLATYEPLSVEAAGLHILADRATLDEFGKRGMTVTFEGNVKVYLLGVGPSRGKAGF